MLKARLIEVIGDALVLANNVRFPVDRAGDEADGVDASQAGFDVFNALTLQDNPLFLEALKVRFCVVPPSSC